MERALANNNKEIIEKSVTEASRAIQLIVLQTPNIERIADVLMDAYRRGKKMVLFGNGGSAADAQHLAAELVGSYANRTRRAIQKQIRL